MEIPKISRRRPRSVDDAELGHFTLSFYRGRQRNVQRFLTWNDQVRRGLRNNANDDG